MLNRWRIWILAGRLGLLGLVCLASIQLACLVSADESLAIPPAVIAAQQQRSLVMRKAADATVAIFGLDGGGGGSGVIVTPDGYALTNYHVSSACGDHMRCGLNDGRIYDAVIVSVDATGDVSLIKLLGREDFPTAPLANSDDVRVGQWCFAAGNPFVLATNLQPSISLGIVSGVNRYQYPAGTLLEYADCIQTDAAINPGNSGGPLFNLAGEVIGINGRCSFEKRGRINVGVGYAISSNQLKYFMGMLRSGRLVDHATLGATVSTDDSGKILVSNILSSSDAYRRGLRYGDEIIALADREVRTTNTFKNILGTLPRDWRIPIEVRREGNTHAMLVRLDGVHTQQQLIDLISAEVAPENRDPHDPQKLEEDAPNKPEGKLAEQPEDDANLPPAPGQPDTKLVQSMLEPRPGFANYYFNHLNRDRIWNSLQQHGDFGNTSSSWKLTGQLAGEPTAVAIEIGPESANLKIGNRSLDVSFANNMSDTIAARRESGLLVGLRALQQFLQVGPQKLGDTIYLGTVPIYRSGSSRLSEQPRHDVLQSLWYDAKLRIYVDPNLQQVTLIEAFGDAANDPVEVYFDQYQPFQFGEQTLQFPSRIRLQYGTDPMLLLHIQGIDGAANIAKTETDAQNIELNPNKEVGR